ncbi:MAG TPA: inositol monophosphatase family protein [Gemmatimonadales bacterium]|nr:inositol monophosphatase family protein [Gemmatimonadales bacterium]
MRDYNDLVKLAARAAARAASYIRTASRPAPQAWTEKGQNDFVTEVDRAAESLIAEALVREVPGSLVVGEEFTPDVATSGEVVWIVDPLDGTTNFLHGYPQFAVSIGCAVRGELCAGVIHDVTRDVVYRAARGGGAWLGDARVRVSSVVDPRRALVATGFPFRELSNLDDYLRQFAAVTRAASGIRRAGSAALDLAHVAAGHFDAFWELGLAPWDIAAGVMLIREAGGRVTRLDGSEALLTHGDIVGGNPAMHEWLLGLLRTA